jgi:hypothetical protein
VSTPLVTNAQRSGDLEHADTGGSATSRQSQVEQDDAFCCSSNAAEAFSLGVAV